jgi:heptosyltransferase-1
MKRILIVKLSAMGDILHALPVSASLGRTFPHLDITWVVEEAYAPLLTGNPYLHDIVTVRRARGLGAWSPALHIENLRHIRSLADRRFDLAIDLQCLTKSATIVALSGARRRIGYHFRRELARLLIPPAPIVPTASHVVDHYLDVARRIGGRTDTAEFPFHIPEEDRRSAMELIRAGCVDPNGVYVVVNPASASAEKQWGAERFAALIDALRSDFGLPTVLVTADRAVAESVRRAASSPYADLSGQTSLKQLAAVLAGSAVHACCDTGSAHLAVALGRPVIALYGPSDPDRTGPYGQRANVITRRDECSVAGCNRHCRLDVPRCLHSIPVGLVAERVAALAT